jgi:hypothetical protein
MGFCGVADKAPALRVKVGGDGVFRNSKSISRYENMISAAGKPDKYMSQSAFYKQATCRHTFS